METIITIDQATMRDIKKKVLPFVSTNPARSNLGKILIHCVDCKVHFVSADGFAISKYLAGYTHGFSKVVGTKDFKLSIEPEELKILASSKASEFSILKEGENYSIQYGKFNLELEDFEQFPDTIMNLFTKNDIKVVESMTYGEPLKKVMGTLNKGESLKLVFCGEESPSLAKIKENENVDFIVMPMKND